MSHLNSNLIALTFDDCVFDYRHHCQVDHGSKFNFHPRRVVVIGRLDNNSIKQICCREKS